MLNSGTTKVYLFTLENYNEAKDCYDKALEMDPKMISHSQKDGVWSGII
jgi:tetratricopeptide (TPR) repeat protein